MAIDYSNLPIPDKDIKKDSSDDTIKFFDAYNKKQLQFKASEGDAVIAFFQSRGMESNAAKSTALIFLKQCKLDGVNPLQLIDQLKSITDEVKMTDTLGKILNINRIPTSGLGVVLEETEENTAKRNIIA
jgi:hypothetical protein